MTWTLPGAILFLLVLVLLLGYFLARKVFPEGENRDSKTGALDGSPCDGCDVPGCGGFARELIRGGPREACSLGREGPSCPSTDTTSRGLPPSAKAVIRCQGKGVSIRYRYSGARSCQAASRMAVRPKSCANACLGFGDCCPLCPSRAIRLEHGIARIDPDRCNGCGECLRACPVGLISLIPAEIGLARTCMGLSGSSEPTACPDGCDGCAQCVAACPEQALLGTHAGLPQWIPERCTGCGLCVEACPRGVLLLFTQGEVWKASEPSRKQSAGHPTTQAASFSPGRGISSRQ